MSEPTPTRCTGEPVSWLRLERYHLGEVDDAERERTAAHLAECAACASCLAGIRADDGVAFPAISAPPATGAKVHRLSPAALVSSALGAVAAAAAVALALRGGGTGRGPMASGLGVSRVKGNAVAFTLVREDGARIDGDVGVYRDGERFKALVTCAPGAGVSLDLVVYDAEGAAFPLQPAPWFSCGNDAPIPGAFRLTGHREEQVCIAWSSTGAVERSALAAGPGASPQQMCKMLTGTSEP
jgi:hypothetical protein